jgi:sugar phosphate isomerase/epimerase
MKLVMFSKHLQELPLPKVADTLLDLGLQGVDLTVRPGGHIEPAEVETKLPQALEVFSDKGLDIGMLTTAILDAREPHAEAIFATAAECGIGALKLGYYLCEHFGSFWSDFSRTMVQLDGLEGLAADYGVSANLHIHCGPFVTATAQTVSMLLEDRDPRYVGAFVDSGHMAIEGGYGGWVQGLDMLAGRINLVALKAMGWTPGEDPGTPAWRLMMVPLRQGIIDIKLFLRHAKASGFDGTVTFHSEYQGSHSFRDLSLPELIEQTRQDVAYVKGLLAEG